MNLENLILFVQNKEIEQFKTEYKKYNYTQDQKQKLLTIIIDEYFNHKNFSFFKKIFDTIIESKVNLNFDLEYHWEVHFLALVASKAPFIEVFDYFIDNGAKLNYHNKSNDITERKTCLDFIKMKFYDSVSDNEFFYMTDVTLNFDDCREDKVCINKSDYLDLLERSEYLKDIFNTFKIMNHIIAIGGKNYVDIHKNTNK